MLRNQLCYLQSKKMTFSGRELLTALDKMNTFILKSKTCEDCGHFLKDFANTEIVARSLIERGLSCFCAEVFSEADDYSAFHLFDNLLVRLPDLGWDKSWSSEVSISFFSPLAATEDEGCRKIRGSNQWRFRVLLQSAWYSLSSSFK